MINLENNQKSFPLDSITQRANLFSIFAGTFLLILGYCFYLTIRGFDPLHLSLATSSQSQLTQYFKNSLPSLLHIMAFSFLSMSFVNQTQINILRIIFLWLALNIVFEFFQYNNFLLAGTFDLHDIGFAFIGAAIVYAVFLIKTKIIISRPYNAQNVNFKLSRLSQTSFLFLGIISMLGSLDTIDAKPVYMSYSELRSAFSIETDKPLLQADKLLRFNQMLLINVKNKGIHLFDEIDTASPAKNVFLNIPGNVDMQINDGYLFADSYIDLLVIDIRNLNNITLIKRLENVFPYNSHQSIPGHVILLDHDESKGVVIDYIPVQD